MTYHELLETLVRYRRLRDDSHEARIEVIRIDGFLGDELVTIEWWWGELPCRYRDGCWELLTRFEMPLTATRIELRPQMNEDEREVSMPDSAVTLVDDLNEALARVLAYRIAQILTHQRRDRQVQYETQRGDRWEITLKSLPPDPSEPVGHPTYLLNGYIDECISILYLLERSRLETPYLLIECNPLD